MTTRIVIGGKPVRPTHAATGSHLPPVEERLPRTAAELNLAPPDPGPCPECGQARPGIANTFATGSRGASPVPARGQYDTAEVTDPETGLPVGDFLDVTAGLGSFDARPSRVTTEE